MEDTPLKKPNRIYGILGTLAWMLLAFVAGVYVGTRPEWIPNMNWAWHPDNDRPPAGSLHVPVTQPDEDSTTRPAQTQASPMGQ